MTRVDPYMYRQWLDEILQRGVNLTPYEADFVESLSQRYPDGEEPRLSAKQASVLERIYTERVP